jgi:hypothetical protein
MMRALVGTKFGTMATVYWTAAKTYRIERTPRFVKFRGGTTAHVDGLANRRLQPLGHVSSDDVSYRTQALPSNRRSSRMIFGAPDAVRDRYKIRYIAPFPIRACSQGVLRNACALDGPAMSTCVAIQCAGVGTKVGTRIRVTAHLAQPIGAVDLCDCPYRPRACKCEPKCKVCGFGKHMAIHGPVFGRSPGSKPYDHEFDPERAQ